MACRTCAGSQAHHSPSPQASCIFCAHSSMTTSVAWETWTKHGNAWQSSKAIIVVVKDCAVGSCRFMAGSLSFSSIIALAFLIEVLWVVLLLQLMACRICRFVFCIKSSTSSQLALLVPPSFDLMQHPPGKCSLLLLGGHMHQCQLSSRSVEFCGFLFFWNNISSALTVAAPCPWNGIL